MVSNQTAASGRSHTTTAQPRRFPTLPGAWNRAATGRAWAQRRAGSIFLRACGNPRTHISMGARPKSCGQFSPSDDMAFRHRCFLCRFQQSEGTISPSEIPFIALNSISSGLTTFPWPLPSIFPITPQVRLPVYFWRRREGQGGPSIVGASSG